VAKAVPKKETKKAAFIIAATVIAALQVSEPGLGE